MTFQGQTIGLVVVVAVGVVDVVSTVVGSNAFAPIQRLVGYRLTNVRFEAPVLSCFQKGCRLAFRVRQELVGEAQLWPSL